MAGKALLRLSGKALLQSGATIGYGWSDYRLYRTRPSVMVGPTIDYIGPDYRLRLAANPVLRAVVNNSRHLAGMARPTFCPGYAR